jgi:ABC-2 type transport system permease protein
MKARPLVLRTLAIAEKEALHLVRDRQAMGLALGTPLILVLLFGFAISFDVEHVRMIVVDDDRSAASRALLRAFTAAGLFVEAPAVDPLPLALEPGDAAARVEPSFRAGVAKTALVVPEGYARGLDRDEGSPFQLLVDGADGTTAQAAIGYALDVGQTFALGERTLPVAARTRLLFNPRMASAWFMVPGVIGVILAVLGTLLCALTIAREWERGSMEQLFATPTSRLPVVLGKLLPYVVLGLVQALLVLDVGVWVFEVPFRGSVLALMLACALFLVCALGQGFLISVVTKSQQLATQIGAVSSILPALLLSGFIFPIANMPLPLRAISRVVPTRYFLPIARGLMLQGKTMADLWAEYLGLAALALVLVTLCTRRFQRRLDA